MENYLVENYNLNNIQFTKPTKQGEYLVSKIKYNSEKSTRLTLQFPKMKIKDIVGSKNIELEFLDNNSYTKKIKKFLSELDTFIIDTVSSNSQEWFDKKLTSDKIQGMYNKCNVDTVKFSVNKSSEIVYKNEKLDITELKKESLLESISKMKYLIFSKDTCFVSWEMCTSKYYKKTNKIPKFGFIEDPDDQAIMDSDSEDESLSFF